MKGAAVSAQTVLQGSETVTRELLRETSENNFCKRTTAGKLLIFHNKQTEKNELVARPGFCF